MVFFRVTQNINIKATDGTLVKYLKLKKPSELISEHIYCTTYNDINSIKKIFKRVGSEYKLRVMDEKKFTSKEEFPLELGISNKNEFNILKKHEYEIEQNPSYIVQKTDKSIQGFSINEKPSLLYDQLNVDKKTLKVMILGGIGKDIGEIVNSLSAVRILYEQLLKRFTNVKIDMYLISSDNTFYSRDKDIMKNEYYINAVFPLCLSVKKMSTYDFYIDNSSIRHSNYYSHMTFVDAYLHKFGIDSKKVPTMEKHNHLDISSYKPKQELVDKLNDLKIKGELLLYHPYSTSSERSMPSDVSIMFLKKLIKKSNNKIIISVLNLDKFKSDSYVNLTSYSKTYYDFVYIISRMDKVICVDTATYHISDAFFIPTVVLFSGVKPKHRIKHYTMTKAIEVIDRTKYFSKFVFDNDALSLYKFEGWGSVKVGKVIKLLETIR